MSVNFSRPSVVSMQEESTWPSDDEADNLGDEEQMEVEAGAGAASGEAGSMGEEAEQEGDRADAGYIQVFLLKYVCPRTDCFGTMVPIQAGSSVHLCNMCGCHRTEVQFLADLEAAHNDEAMAAA